MKKELIELLEQRLSLVDEGIAILEMAPIEALSHHEDDKKWSALENIEHLHRYNEFYLAEFRKSLDRAEITDSNELNRGKFGMKSA